MTGYGLALTSPMNSLPCGTWTAGAGDSVSRCVSKNRTVPFLAATSIDVQPRVNETGPATDGEY